MQHWVFGYGSLIWRTDFPYHERCRAAVPGWSRRFWQGSHDHRGLPDAPGRVVTLIQETDALCIGAAYRVDEAVFGHLDRREKNGYHRVAVAMQLARTASPTHETATGVTYIASPDNAAFLGPADVDEMVRHIARSSGPSGTNTDYLLQLAAALDDLGCDDRHVRELVCRLRATPTFQ